MNSESPHRFCSKHTCLSFFFYATQSAEQSHNGDAAVCNTAFFPMGQLVTVVHKQMLKRKIRNHQEQEWELQTFSYLKTSSSCLNRRQNYLWLEGTKKLKFVTHYKNLYSPCVFWSKISILCQVLWSKTNVSVGIYYIRCSISVKISDISNISDFLRFYIHTFDSA